MSLCMCLCMHICPTHSHRVMRIDNYTHRTKTSTLAPILLTWVEQDLKHLVWVVADVVHADDTVLGSPAALFLKLEKSVPCIMVQRSMPYLVPPNAAKWPLGILTSQQRGFLSTRAEGRCLQSASYFGRSIQVKERNLACEALPNFRHSVEAGGAPKHCRFQASTAPPGRIPSTHSTRSSAGTRQTGTAGIMANHEGTGQLFA